MHAITARQTLLVLATLAAVFVIPDWPHRHLDDPAYWGMLGCFAAFVILLGSASRPWDARSVNRRIVRLFIAGLPIIYVAGWIRFGGSTTELVVQSVGLVIWFGAALASGRSDLVLWVAVAAHAVWDAAHFGRVEFIPAWYVAACMTVDLGLAAFILLGLRSESAERIFSP